MDVELEDRPFLRWFDSSIVKVGNKGWKIQVVQYFPVVDSLRPLLDVYKVRRLTFPTKLPSPPRSMETAVFITQVAH